MTTQWLERRLNNQLPVSYFLVTFTLPSELRSVTRRYQSVMYDLLFRCSSAALRELSANPRFLGGDIGLTGVLHTHSRKLDYHPHVHYVTPACAINRSKNICIHSKSSFLVPQQALNRLFIGKFLAGLKMLGIRFPSHLYRIDWVVHCQSIGTGNTALKYLSRYLYRGVIAEKNIIRDHAGQVTFRYTEGQTGSIKTRTLPGDQFLNIVLQHALPKGFRRVRDYGFLHGNAKKTLHQLQLLLKPKLPKSIRSDKPSFVCSICGSIMQTVAVCVFSMYAPSRERAPPIAEK